MKEHSPSFNILSGFKDLFGSKYLLLFVSFAFLFLLSVSTASAFCTVNGYTEDETGSVINSSVTANCKGLNSSNTGEPKPTQNTNNGYFSFSFGGLMGDNCSDCDFVHVEAENETLAKWGYYNKTTGLDVGQVEKNLTLNDYFNWRDYKGKDWVSPVKNQGNCGSCWAFAAVGAAEANFNYGLNKSSLNPDLAEQHLVSGYQPSSDCDGGSSEYAIYKMRDKGIVEEDYYPYKASNSDMEADIGSRGNWSDRVWMVDRTEDPYINDSLNDNETIKEHIKRNGPITTGIYMHGSFDDGVYKGCGDNLPDHAITIVGFSDAGDYWIAKNSWGSNWGPYDNGFFKIDYDTCPLWLDPEESQIWMTKERDNIHPSKIVGGSGDLSKLRKRDNNHISFTDNYQVDLFLNTTKESEEFPGNKIHDIAASAHLYMSQSPSGDVELEISKNNTKFNMSSTFDPTRFNLCKREENCSEILSDGVNLTYTGTSGSSIDMNQIFISITYDRDGDGYLNDNDCNDLEDNMNKGLKENIANGNCNDGIDNDCDGIVDSNESDCQCKEVKDGDYFTTQTDTRLCSNEVYNWSDSSSGYAVGLWGEDMTFDCQNSTIIYDGVYETHELIHVTGREDGWAHNVTIKNCTLRRGHSIKRGRGIRINQVPGLTLKDTTIEGFYRGIWLDDKDGKSSANFTIFDNKITGNEVGFLITKQQKDYNFSIYSNNLSNNGVGIEASRAENFTIKENLFKNTSEYAVRTKSNTSNFNVTNNYWGVNDNSSVYALINDTSNAIIDKYPYYCEEDLKYEAPCDCVPEMVNTSWSDWYEVEECSTQNTKTQGRNRTEYDKNSCGIEGNTTYEDTQLVECDYCSPDPTNTSWSDWQNETSCRINDTTVQNRSATQYDANHSTCYEVTGLESDLWNNGTNETVWEHQEISCDYCTPDWEEVNTSCQTDDTITGWYNDTNDCYSITGLESDNNPPTNNTYSCDYCTPNSTNTTWSSWYDIESCQTNDSKTQERNKTEYDSNDCYSKTGLSSDEFTNTTYTETQEVSCDYCSPSPTNTSWSGWQDETSCRVNDTKIENRSKVEYDANYSTCYEVTGLSSDLWNSGENNTYWEEQEVSCDYCSPDPTNTSWSDWQNQTSCRINDTILQNRSATEYDANHSTCYEVTGLDSDLWNNGTNKTSWDYQEISCDYCTPDWEEVNTSCQTDDTITGWYNDTNDCYSKTGLESDNNPPTNNTYGCDYCTPNSTNTTWSSWYDIESCQTNDSKTQERNKTEYDSNDCYSKTGLSSDEFTNTTYTETQEVSCDYCSSDPTNTSWSGWQDETSCRVNDTKIENRSKVEYDANHSTCYEVTGLSSDLWNSGENNTYWEEQEVSCDYCSPDPTNTSWSDWQNQTNCTNNTVLQNRSATEYDSNHSTCYEVTGLDSDLWNNGSNETVWDYREVSCGCTPDMVNTSWSSWYDIESCQTNDQKTQERNKTEYDQNNCGTEENTTYTETREVECDYCEPNPTNTSWSDWYDIESCQSDDTKQQERTRTEYDSNDCYSKTGLSSDEFTNTTHTDTQTVTCDYCETDMVNTSWSSWYDIESCQTNDQKTQERNKTEYDQNHCGEEENTTYTETQTVSCDYCTPDWEEVNTSCQTDDTVTGWYNDTNDCYSKTGLDSDNNPPSNNTYSCDYCSPDSTNTSWSSWYDIESCQTDDTKQQERTKTEYDGNDCYSQTGLSSDEFTNTTHTETQTVSCDYCTPDATYTDWSSWQDIEECRSDGTKQQERTRTEYDGNDCYSKTGLSSDEFDETTETDTREVECDPDTLYLYEGWNLISVPLDEGMDISTIKNNCGGQISDFVWYWGNGKYEKEYQTLDQSKGYWMYRSSSGSCNVNLGTASFPSELNLDSGWNMVPAPGEGSVENFFGNCNIDSPIWKWDGNKYEDVTSFELGEGYWIYTDNACKMYKQTTSTSSYKVSSSAVGKKPASIIGGDDSHTDESSNEDETQDTDYDQDSGDDESDSVDEHDENEDSSNEEGTHDSSDDKSNTDNCGSEDNSDDYTGGEDDSSSDDVNHGWGSIDSGEESGTSDESTEDDGDSYSRDDETTDENDSGDESGDVSEESEDDSSSDDVNHGWR